MCVTGSAVLYLTLHRGKSGETAAVGRCDGCGLGWLVEVVVDM